MELIIPSLVALFLGLAIALFVFPTIAPALLITGSMVAIAIAAYIHWKQFGTAEYARSTWQNNLRMYTSLVLIGIIIACAYGFYAMNATGVTVGPFESTPSLPNLQAPQIGGMSHVLKTVGSRINDLLKKGGISE